MSSGIFQVHKLMELRNDGVSLADESTSSSKPSSIYIRKGDALIQTTEALAVGYATTDMDSYCFSGTQIVKIEEHESDLNCSHFKGSAVVDPISYCGVVFFRSEDYPKLQETESYTLPFNYTDGRSVPLIKIIVQHGNIYINQISTIIANGNISIKEGLFLCI